MKGVGLSGPTPFSRTVKFEKSLLVNLQVRRAELLQGDATEKGPAHVAIDDVAIGVADALSAAGRLNRLLQPLAERDRRCDDARDGNLRAAMRRRHAAAGHRRSRVRRPLRDLTPSDLVGVLYT